MLILKAVLNVCKSNLQLLKLSVGFFSCLFLLFWIKTDLQYSVGLHVFI